MLYNPTFGVNVKEISQYLDIRLLSHAPCIFPVTDFWLGCDAT